MHYIDLFLHHLASERHLSAATVDRYRRGLKSVKDYLAGQGRESDLTDLTTGDVRGWMMHELGEGKDVATVKPALSALRTFYKYLRLRGLVDHNPMQTIVTPKAKKRLPVFVRESEMDRLLDEVEFPEGIEGRLHHLILQTFYSTGVRVSELIGLNVGSIDFGTQTLKVLGKRNKERIIPFEPELGEELRAYVALRNEQVAQDDALFIGKTGKRISQGAVERIVHYYLGQVTTLKKRSPHVLRHSFATAMLNHGADIRVVQELLGHESVETTAIYTHLTVEDIKRSYKQAHPRG